MSLVQQSGLVNSQNSHFSNPGFSSRVGAASGCGGSVTSADALNQTGMYEVMKIGGAKKCPKSCKCNCHNFIAGANVLVNVVVLVIKNVLEIVDVDVINVIHVEKDIAKEEVKNVQ